MNLDIMVSRFIFPNEPTYQPNRHRLKINRCIIPFLSPSPPTGVPPTQAPTLPPSSYSLF
uniref:Uncharacterized protein n=1 Tax=Kalanchoe fedtschenkoi TaxID=63787 RepID=A0A7N0UCR8_KALFE